jgi:hypothetical protein
LTELQKKLYTFYLDNYARAGQIGEEGQLEGKIIKPFCLLLIVGHN